MKAKRLLEIIRDFEYPHVNEAVQIKTATDWRQLCLMESKVETLEWFLGFAVGDVDFDIENLREMPDPDLSCDGKIVEIEGIKYELREVK